ncbi:hypothetical protein EV702DRAFT_1199793 [Suillus placidus]|uniref:Uncharacterized protein n=1 Tax=Suillus placidus TaxID=48579 RepID=A0A9P6ZSD6_9AGAM|nr:hypothetical protein EV702DRAFT_1199793 [Suillus placidus]
MSQSRDPSPSLTNGYRTCRCKPSCGKWLSKSARNKHYRRFINDELEYMQDSDQEDNEDRDVEQESGGSSNDRDSSGDTGSSEDAMSIDDDHSQGTCSDIDCDESSNHSYALETPISIPDNFVFDEDADDDEYLHLLLEDIAAQLDAWANPKADGDFYDICNDIITEEDRDNIRAFQLKMFANIPHHAYD